jgi:hypothetical protein
LDILAENGIRSSSKNDSDAKTSPLFKEAFDEGEKKGYKDQDLDLLN